MKGRTFMNAISNSEVDILQLLLDILADTGSQYCVIGGLAVNAYAEPVVSLDLDIVVAAENIDELCEEAKAKGLKVRKFEHSVNFTSPKSDLRIQLQTDSRYQEFIARSLEREILGYTMMTASMEDVLQGKIWAYQDKARRRSKRQKDLADIMRLIEVKPASANQLPPEIREGLEK